MSILARIRANGGDVIRDEWRFSLKRGRLSPEAVAWLKSRWSDACAEAWPLLGEWEERAAIREFDGGQSRADAERAAYAEVGHV
jgi:hypothetical protein